jgi:hypothetical protein
VARRPIITLAAKWLRRRDIPFASSRDECPLPTPLRSSIKRQLSTMPTPRTYEQTITKDESMVRVLRLDGNRIRDLTEDQRTAFRVKAAKIPAITALALAIILTLIPAFTLVDEVFGHAFLPYKKELKDVPAVVHAAGLLLMLLVLYKIVPQCVYTITSDEPSVFIDNGGVYIGGTRTEIEGLEAINFDNSWNEVHVTFISGERRKILPRGLCWGMADLFKAFGASEVLE